MRQGYITRLEDNNLEYRMATRDIYIACSLLEYFVTLLFQRQKMKMNSADKKDHRGLSLEKLEGKKVIEKY